MGATVDEGNIVVFGPQESYIETQEHWPEDSDEQEARRACGAVGRTTSTRSTKAVRFDEPNTDSVFKRPA